MDDNFNNFNFETGSNTPPVNNQGFGPTPTPEQPQSTQQAADFGNFNVQTQSQGMQGSQFNTMPQQPMNNMMPGYVDNSVSVGMIILGILFPIVGWIYWGVKGKTRPRAAKAAGIAGIISFVINLIITFGLLAGAGSLAKWVKDNADIDIDSIVDEDLDWDDSDWDFDLEEDNDTEDDTTKLSSEKTTEGSTSSTSASTPSGKATDWKTNKFTLDGKEYQLPINMNDFLTQSGYKFQNNSDSTSTLNDNYTGVVTISKGEKRTVVTLLNDTGAQTVYPNCKLVSISSQTISDAYDIGTFFAGDLSAGTKTSKDTLISRFGEPDYTYDDTDYHKLEWKNNLYNGFEVILRDDGAITEVSLRNYGK